MPTSHGRSSTLSVALALGTVYIVWGSTYLAIAYVVETLPPIMAGGIRFTVAGSLLLAFILAQAWWRRRRAPASRLVRPRLIEWRTAAIVGTFLLLGGNGLVSVAELRIPSYIAAVIIATVPIWMSLGEALLTRRMPSWLAISGLRGRAGGRRDPAAAVGGDRRHRPDRDRDRRLQRAVLDGRLAVRPPRAAAGQPADGIGHGAAGRRRRDAGR